MLAGFEKEDMPKHVAVIMDGNGRWAKKKELEPWLGHEAGSEALTRLYQSTCRLGIRVLTVFAFSCENWKRSKMEVEFIFKLMIESFLEPQQENFMKYGVKVSAIGELSKLPMSLQKAITKAKEETKNNKNLQLILAISYSGQYDLVQACQSIAHNVKDGLIELQDIDQSLLQLHLQTNCTEFPNPDLLIRTSGELRLSNFLMWQLAYTELYFIHTLWPDFGETELLEAVRAFQKRQRRFGKRDTALVNDQNNS